VVNVPLIHFYEYDVSEVASPIGLRHIEGAGFAFEQRLALGCQTYTGIGTSGTLNFGELQFDFSAPVSHVESDVQAVIMRIANSGFVLTNMRLYLTDDTALRVARDAGLDPAFVQYTTSGIWQPNALLPSGAGTRLSTTIPATQNLFRQDGNSRIDRNDDHDVSQFIYMNIVAPLGIPLGTFGVCGSGLLRFAVQYDYFEGMSELN
jgi:hypothetical protein